MGNEAGRFTAVKDLNVIVHNLKEDQVKIEIKMKKLTMGNSGKNLGQTKYNGFNFAAIFENHFFPTFYTC